MDSKRTNLRSPREKLTPEPVRPPSRRSASARHPLVVLGSAVFTILVILSVLVGAALIAGKQRFEARGPLAEDKTVNIPRGLGIRDIADLLVREGVIDQPYVFIGGVIILKARDELKFGEYRFGKEASLHDVIATITEGKVVQHQLTMPEGLTSEQMIQRLLENDVLAGNIREIPREGTLLPETYKFTRGATREQLIQRMQQAQRRVVQETWDRRSAELPLNTPEQLVILASIVEKETGRPDERARVAAVFVNRLKRHMRLQSDPTIIYGLVGGKGSLGRPILVSEIEQPTPYNTYAINGLPPGPIANPGRAALEAAANPARTRELFFVADGSGGHIFADTLDQHQKNVSQLRAVERAQRDSSATPMMSQPTSTPPPSTTPPASATPARRPPAAPAASTGPAASATPAAPAAAAPIRPTTR